MARNKSSSGQIRIISGQWRSRRLPVQDHAGLRPTTDRVRETVFNWLAADIAGARVLDCFAGSGALGFEALSRYADFTQFFELQTNAAKQLIQNLHTLNCQTADVRHGDSLQLLKQAPKEGFDIVFIDPPFRKNLVAPCIQSLVESNWLNQDALIYIEMESDAASIAIPDNWQLLKSKQAGQVSYNLYQA